MARPVYGATDGALMVSAREESGQIVPIDEWTTHEGCRTAAGLFLRLRDEGRAEPADETGTRMAVDWGAVCALTSGQLRSAGLPPRSPHRLTISGSGTVRDADLRIDYGFRKPTGERIAAPRLTGGWLAVGEQQYTVSEPVLNIVDAIQGFERAKGATRETRMLAWGRIKDSLPEDAVVEDDRLNDVDVYVPEAFELQPFRNQAEEPDFNPVLGRYETAVDPSTDEAHRAFRATLPRAQQAKFADVFRRLRTAKRGYATNGGTYVILPESLATALKTVRNAQRGSAEERRRFLRDAGARIRRDLDTQGLEDTEVQAVFNTDGLSERVEKVGIWQPRTLPWVRRPSEPWLPPEELGIRIGEESISIEPGEINELIEKVEAAVEQGEPTVRIRGGGEIPATEDTLKALKELTGHRTPEPKGSDGEAERKPAAEDVVLIVTDNLEDLKYGRRPRRRRRAIGAESPAALRSTLLAHQETAVAWFRDHWNSGSWGCLLADDMGLGKTLEALAHLSRIQANARRNGRIPGPMLIVAPTGLLLNWIAEHDRHLARPGLGRRVDAHGRTLKAIRTDTVATGNETRTDDPLPKLDLTVLREADWVVTTYETLRDYQHSFGRIRWSAAVFDEAQKIKNAGARMTEAALAMNIGFTILVTGTPVENRPADVWPLLDRAEPGMFGTLRDFSRDYEGDENRTATLGELRRRLTERPEPPIMLRRLKADHLTGLPEKRVHRRVVPMPAGQADAYEKAIVDAERGDGRQMLKTLQAMRSISLHPFRDDKRDVSEYVAESARLAETWRILADVKRRDEKALVFVESREMQDFLIGGLRASFDLAEDVLVINGSVSGDRRKSRVDRFQKRTGFDVMILSPKAGGVGLTLTAANHVVHLSRWWNPAVEDQCTDRVFRIGQARPVHVYLPLAEHPRMRDYSFDLRLDAMLERKRADNRTVLASTVPEPTDMRELFNETTRGNDAAETGGKADAGGVEDIDILEPKAFERWVLEQLKTAGYRTALTPETGDGGADGIASWTAGTAAHTLIVQCKHMQSDRHCGADAVDEAVRATGRYPTESPAVPMVVTNARGYTPAAVAAAEKKGAILVDRGTLALLLRADAAADRVKGTSPARNTT